MKLPALLLVLLTVCLPTAAQESPSMRKASSYLRSRQYAKAADAYAKITAEDPSNGEAWFSLGSAHHGQKDWAAAIEANRRAAEFASQRPSALYNMACAQSLSGALDEAEQSLGLAIESGFLDIDLVATDTDLDPLRARIELPLPRKHEYRELKARNGIRMQFSVIEPAGFDPERSYPVLVAFSPGSGPRSTDWMLDELWSGVEEQADWIVVSLVAPESKGWYTHPSHHALEDVLKKLQKEYKVAGGNFHLFGFASGCGAAMTYSGMSRKYFQTMTLVSSTGWGNYDDSDYDGWRDMPVHQIVGESSYTLELDRAAHERLTAVGCKSHLEVIPDNGLLVTSLRGTDLLAEIARVQLATTE
jgi:hypothetical protein